MKVLRYKEYFKDNGGITLSGGEPLLQPQFAKDIFNLAKENGFQGFIEQVERGQETISVEEYREV